MGLIVNILFLVVATSLLAISGGFVTDASRKIGNVPNYQNDPNLSSAHKYSAIAAVLCWILIALMILGIVLYVIFAFESVEYTGSIFISGLLFLSLFATIAVGILASIASAELGKSKVSTNSDAHKQATISAVLAIVGGVFLLVGILFYFFHKPKPKKTEEDTEISKLKSELGEGGEVSSPSWYQSAISKGELAGEFAGEI